MLYILDFLCWYLLVYYAIFCPTLNKDFNNNNKRFLPPLLYFCNYEPSPNGQIISLISKRDLIPVRSFWKDHLFRTSEKKYIAMYFFFERSSFIFRPGGKIIFSGKRNIIFPDNTWKIIFQRNFFGKTNFSGRLEKENMVFRAVRFSLFILIMDFPWGAERGDLISRFYIRAQFSSVQFSRSTKSNLENWRTKKLLCYRKQCYLSEDSTRSWSATQRRTL